VVGVAELRRIFSIVEASPNASFSVDLATQTLTLPDGTALTFPISAFSKHCLLNGVDELGYILQQESAIAAYEQAA
jgi:3-isopropylmalate/(R)-2-methylmalate dehydratase small subunit